MKILKIFLLLYFILTSFVFAQKNEQKILPTIYHENYQNIWLDDIAQNNPILFFNIALENYYRTITDYTCIFEKQERRQNKLRKKEIISVKFKEKPFSVFMKWNKNPSLVDHTLYVENQNNNKVIVKPSHMIWFFIKYVERNINNKELQKVSRYKITDFGFGKNLLKITKINSEASQRKDLSLTFKGIKTLHQRAMYVFERYLKDKGIYPDYKAIIYIDQKLLIPIELLSYDKDLKLLGRYSYKNIKLNIGLTDKDFDKNKLF